MNIESIRSEYKIDESTCYKLTVFIQKDGLGDGSVTFYPDSEPWLYLNLNSTRAEIDAIEVNSLTSEDEKRELRRKVYSTEYAVKEGLKSFLIKEVVSDKRLKKHLKGLQIE